MIMKVPAKTTFSNSMAVAAVFQALQNQMADADPCEADREHFWCALLNTRNVVKSVNLIAVGCLSGALVHPREVFRPAVAESAAAIVLCHNHPSGDPSPSPEDVQLTERLVEAGRILGIRVLDHVIIADGGYASVMDKANLS